MNLATVNEHLQVIYKNCANDGWLDGQGTAITEETVQPFLELLKKYAEDIPTAITYPTLDGGLIMEWDSSFPVYPSLEVSLKTLTGYYVDMSTKEDGEEDLDLSCEEGWKKLSNYIREARI